MHVRSLWRWVPGLWERPAGASPGQRGCLRAGGRATVCRIQHSGSASALSSLLSLKLGHWMCKTSNLLSPGVCASPRPDAARRGGSRGWAPLLNPLWFLRPEADHSLQKGRDRLCVLLDLHVSGFRSSCNGHVTGHSPEPSILIRN